MNSGAVTVIWSSLRFGHPHSQNLSSMGILCNPNSNPNRYGNMRRGCPYHYGFGNGDAQNARMPITPWQLHFRNEKGTGADLQLLLGSLLRTPRLPIGQFFPCPYSNSPRNLCECLLVPVSLLFLKSHEISPLYLLQSYNCCWVSVDEILTSDHSLKSYFAALYYWLMYYI